MREQADPADRFEHGEIRLVTEPTHTVHALDVRIPRGRMSVVTGVSGSGKTTMVLKITGASAAGRDRPP